MNPTASPASTPVPGDAGDGDSGEIDLQEFYDPLREAMIDLSERLTTLFVSGHPDLLRALHDWNLPVTQTACSVMAGSNVASGVFYDDPLPDGFVTLAHFWTTWAIAQDVSSILDIAEAELARLNGFGGRDIIQAAIDHLNGAIIRLSAKLVSSGAGAANVEQAIERAHSRLGELTAGLLLLPLDPRHVSLARVHLLGVCVQHELMRRRQVRSAT